MGFVQISTELLGHIFGVWKNYYRQVRILI